MEDFEILKKADVVGMTTTGMFDQFFWQVELSMTGGEEWKKGSKYNNEFLSPHLRYLCYFSFTTSATEFQ